MLVGDDLGQRPVGRGLARHRARADQLEAAVEADRAGGGAGRDQLVEPRQQLLVGEPALDPLVDRRLEAGDHGERRPLPGPDRVHVPVDVGPVEAAVEGDHLAVEPVQRAEPEVAVLGQLGEAEVAVVGAVEQGADRRGLEEDVRLALGVQVLPPQRLDVQRPGSSARRASRAQPGDPVSAADRAGRILTRAEKNPWQVSNEPPPPGTMTETLAITCPLRKNSTSARPLP